jgi:hypothetical protein
MYNISHKGNKNQNVIEIPSHPSQNGNHQDNKQQIWIGFSKSIKVTLRSSERGKRENNRGDKPLYYICIYIICIYGKSQQNPLYNYYQLITT